MVNNHQEHKLFFIWKKCKFYIKFFFTDFNSLAKKYEKSCYNYNKVLQILSFLLKQIF